MAKKSVGEKFSDWFNGYRSRPDDEYYDDESYEEEDFFDDDESEHEDEFIELYDEIEDEEEENTRPSSVWKGFGSRRGRASIARDRRAEQEREAKEMNSDRSSPKIYSMDRSHGIDISIVTPARFDGTTKTIIDEIRSGSVLVVKLEQVSRQDYIRFVDFLAGAVYIMGSHMQYINERILIVAPKNVNLSGGEFREIYEVEPVASMY